MTRREQVVRTVLLVLVVAVIATLVVLDLRRGDQEGEDGDPAASPTPSVTIEEEPSESAPSAPGEPGGPDVPGQDALPTPPPGIEALACRELQKPVDVRVLSFNTHRSYGGLTELGREIEAVGADVVLLQEIDRFHARTGGVDQVTYFAGVLGMGAAFSPNVVEGGGQYGTAILSRFPILDSGRYSLPNAPGGEQRGLQWVALDVGGQEVRVYNTHLQHRMPGLRNAQARYVAGILAGERQPTILGGDLNAVPGSPTLRSLQARLVDAWPVAGQGPDGTASDGARIDYVLATAPLAPQSARVLPSAISDHARVLVDYVLPADCPSRGDAG